MKPNLTETNAKVGKCRKNNRHTLFFIDIRNLPDVLHTLNAILILLG
jgi:hypothetical protein